MYKKKLLKIIAKTRNTASTRLHPKHQKTMLQDVWAMPTAEV